MLIRWQSRWLRWRRRFSRAEWAARHFGFALSQESSHAPGLLLIQIDGLARLVAVYRQGTGSFPASWQTLVEAGAVPDVPVDPAGTPYFLDPENGFVTVARESALFPLPAEPPAAGQVAP